MSRGQRLCGHSSSKASAFSFAMEPRQSTAATALLFFGLLFGVEAEEKGSPCPREAAVQGSASPRRRPLGEDDSALGGDRAHGVRCPLVPCCPAGSWGRDITRVGVGESQGRSGPSPHQAQLTGGHGQLAGGPAGLGLRQVAHGGTAQDVHLRAAVTNHKLLHVPQSKGVPTTHGPPQHRDPCRHPSPLPPAPPWRGCPRR